MSPREEIASGALRGAALRDLLASIPFTDRDAWVDAALGMDPSPPDLPDLPRGVVPYLACGVEEILALVRDIPLRVEDVLVDVGSGLGRVVILAHLLSGARAHGVEIQEPLVRAARACAADLGLDGVTFVHGDARDGLPDGSVYFLYAPCNGEMMETVLRRVERIANERSIVVVTVGFELDDRSWLTPRARSHATLALYDSNSRRPVSP